MKCRWENRQEFDTNLPVRGMRETIDVYAEADAKAFKGRLVRFWPEGADDAPWALDTELHLSTGLPRASEWSDLDDAKRAVEEALA